ncbi:YaaW family protein [Kamptonema formosum]|uniref:YaaW family protein n=1 Tax=Kamptonema formosum TaxID=331992 RepID=UPI000348ECE5|nr:YaaW family protein [Oscillatoria sp. PCC 10802]
MDELRAALELATDEELQQLTDILFCRRFNPLDYFQTPDPIDVKSRDRQTWLDTLEQRFRYLAADGITVLRGSTDKVTYRHALIQVCRYLKISYSNKLSTTDLEAEVFLFLMGKAWKKLPASEQEALTERVRGALAQSDPSQPLPLLAQKDPLGLLFKGGSALAVSSVIQPLVLQQIARQFAIHFATYQMAKATLLEGGAAAAAGLETYAALQAARQGMAVTAARYGAVRTVFAFIGPVLWAAFLADLGWRAISTNYARIIPTIFTLAQIRLTRAECWQPA